MPAGKYLDSVVTSPTVNVATRPEGVTRVIGVTVGVPIPDVTCWPAATTVIFNPAADEKADSAKAVLPNSMVYFAVAGTPADDTKGFSAKAIKKYEKPSLF